MNDYRIRNGIVLESICGRYVLISTEAARGVCPYVHVIDDIVAYYWEMMEEGLSITEMTQRAASLFQNIDSNQIHDDICDLIAQMKEYGYLLKDDEE